MEKIQDKIGKYGITQTRMLLTGIVVIGGKLYEAVSDYSLPKNTRVKVVGTSFNILNVTKVRN